MTAPRNLPGITSLLRLKETASTQDVARRLASDGAPAGTLIWADRQSKGRGRLARRWNSPEGGLYLSLILRPSFPPSRLADFSLLAARSAAESLSRLTGVASLVKPPNDVLALDAAGSPRKLCGILSEASGGSRGLDWLILGVGVNVNNRPRSPGAASLSGLTGRTWPIEEVLRRFLSRFAALYTAFALVAGMLWLSPAPASAWGPLGHKAVAMAAQRRLSPAALKALEEILGPGFDLGKISNCSDSMLHTDKPLDCGGAFTLQPDLARATSQWHYIDIPVSEGADAAELSEHCPDGTLCVVAQIHEHAAALKDPGAPRERRRLALMHLVHLAGDLHQPFHCADDHDWGGNKKKVVFLGVKKNLHSLWDDLIMAEDWRQQSAMDPAPLAAEISEGLAVSTAAAWTSGDFVAQAAIESFVIADEIIYPRYARDKGLDLGKDYQDAMRPIVLRRLQMAAARLAALLEGSLGSP